MWIISVKLIKIICKLANVGYLLSQLTSQLISCAVSKVTAHLLYFTGLIRRFLLDLQVKTSLL